MKSRRLAIIVASGLLLVVLAVGIYFIIHARTRSVDNPSRAGTVYNAPLVISVHAVYPGASAQVVAEAVAAPIEQEVNGTESMVSMHSRSANDGSYTLHITFAAGTNLDVAQVVVQNRISLALPKLPAAVQQIGIPVRKQAPLPLMLVGLTAPANRFDEVYLSNYAARQLKDELARVPGVADIAQFGRREYQIRVIIDPDRLAALQLTAADVTAALMQQNVTVVARPMGLPPRGDQFQFGVTTLGRLAEPEQFENITLKALPDGNAVRLRDVARVALVLDDRGNSSANLDGKAAAILCLYPLPNAKPSEVSRAVRERIAELRTFLPEGLELGVSFDFAANLVQPNDPATPEHLVVDVVLPANASTDRVVKTVGRAGELLRRATGVQEVLTLTEHPFSLDRSRPCIIARLTSKDERQLDRRQVAAQLRSALHERIPDARFRMSTPSTADVNPLYGYPLDFALEDHGDHGSEVLAKQADVLVEKLTESGQFADVVKDSGSRPIPNLSLDIDRTKCEALGLDVNEVLKTLQTILGTNVVGNLSQFGRTWQVNVQFDGRFREQLADIKRLQVKNKQNQLIPVGTVVEAREIAAPAAIERRNMHPIARITANLATDVPLADANAMCEAIAQQHLDKKQFKLVWLGR